jgi:hypothetical protein
MKKKKNWLTDISRQRNCILLQDEIELDPQLVSNHLTHSRNGSGGKYDDLPNIGLFGPIVQLHRDATRRKVQTNIIQATIGFAKLQHAIVRRSSVTTHVRANSEDSKQRQPFERSVIRQRDSRRRRKRLKRARAFVRSRLVLGAHKRARTSAQRAKDVGRTKRGRFGSARPRSMQRSTRRHRALRPLQRHSSNVRRSMSTLATSVRPKKTKKNNKQTTPQPLHCDDTVRVELLLQMAAHPTVE